MRNTFIFYRSFAEVLETLPDEEAGRLYKAISKYALDGVETPLEGVVSGYFKLIKPQLDANIAKYENGTKGGRPRKNQTETKTEPSETQTETKTEPNENQEESKTEANQKAIKNDKYIMINKECKNEEGSKKKRFTPPTLEELKEFIKTNNLHIDPERFLDYYQSNGWKVGKNPMKDWKATARNWSRKDKKEEPKRDDSIDQLLEIEQQALRRGK